MLTNRFTFLCTKEDRQIIIRLANSIQRSQGDTLRFLLHEANKALAFSQNVDQISNEYTAHLAERITNKIKENQL